MSTAREEVLRRVREALGEPATTSQPDGIPRLYHTGGDLAPGSDALRALFVERVEDYRASVWRCAADASAISDTVGAALREHGVTSAVLPPGLAGLAASLAEGSVGAGQPVQSGQTVQVRVDDGRLTAAELDRTDAVVTEAAAAVAVTGTIVLEASDRCGRRMITLVPDLHVCIVRLDQVVETVPEVIAVVDPTRPLTFISGPSATSDIELNRVEGVHGPRTLVVVLAG